MQKQEQIPKEEVIPQATFEEICPQWNKIIAKEEGFDNVDVNKDYTDKHNIRKYECCIVGEAFNTDASQ